MTERRRRPRSNDRVWAEYTRGFRRDVLPALLSSAYMISVGEHVTEESVSVQAATELGLMLLLDKPLILIIPNGMVVPDALRRAAAAVVDDVDMADPATQDRIAEVFRRLGALPDAGGDAHG